MRIFLSLILLLTIVPILELVIILQVHHAIASAWSSGPALLVTIGTIAATGVGGAALARHQGLRVLRDLQEQMGRGEMPGQAIMDGVLVLVGAALLFTPGFLTDALGFSLLIPLSRAGYRRLLGDWVRRKIQRGEVRATFGGSGRRVFDVESRPEDAD